MNNSLLITVLNESEKIFRRKRTVVFLASTILIPVGILMAVVLLQNKTGILAISSGQFPFLVLSLFANILLPLFIFTITADLFAGELQDKTLKLVLTQPITRSGVYLAKIMAVVVFNIVSLSILMIVSLSASVFLDGVQRLITELPQIMLSYAVTLIPMALVGVTGIFVAQFFKNGGSALTMSVFLFLGSKAASLVFPSISQLLPFSYNDWYLFWLNGTLGLTKLFYSFIVMFSYALIFFALGSYFFEKKDI